MKCTHFQRRSTPGINRNVEVMENADKLYRDVMVAIAAAPTAPNKEAMRSWAQSAVAAYTEDMSKLWARMQQEGLL
ncbi:hypothetical protein UFOVP228_22 [uncultured Caudovirales phage]|uniref:Uncharacterized protein n=1 Tax=uncultured Caudovirales phage TaxID=2100421 RepID=A0A6J5TC91_9CAUD|nr:hypothetical protein UFOVP47_80 [uncultured Caudovirales phage]CAB5219072.1 hypothetical protein UFOVP228_22 [uncultured Caudovirales phage]